jgi:hypothetical protein
MYGRGYAIRVTRAVEADSRLCIREPGVTMFMENNKGFDNYLILL